MPLLKDKRIFYVDDNYVNVSVIKIILQNNGAQLEIDRWGTETLPKLEAFAPVDVILLDLMLPRGVSGFDLHEKIRSLPKFKDTPIIAVSAMDPAIAMKKAREEGFNGFIGKPIDWNLFPEQISSVISGEPIWYAK